MNQPDTRPTSQRIFHRSFAVIGVVVLFLLAVPILCFGLFFFGGVAVKVDEAMDNAMQEVEKDRANRNANNANAQLSNRSPR